MQAENEVVKRNCTFLKNMIFMQLNLHEQRTIFSTDGKNPATFHFSAFRRLQKIELLPKIKKKYGGYCKYI